MSNPELVVVLKKMGDQLVCCPSPAAARPCSPRLRNAVKRNLNDSFGSGERAARASPRLAGKRRQSTAPASRRELTIVVKRRRNTCDYRQFYDSADSSSDDSAKENLVLATKRKVRPPADLQRLYVSPIKIHRSGESMYVTPVKQRGRMELSTPKTNRVTPIKSTPKVTTQSTPIKATPKRPKSAPVTPKSTLKLIRDGTITPRVQSRMTTIREQDTPLKQARTQLHVSYVPHDLPCRDAEYGEVLQFLEAKLEVKEGGCMYVSGVPGTGKTATVTAAINYLAKCADEGEVNAFETVKINGMQLTEPRQAYVEIIKQLMKKTVPWEQARSMLEDRFTKKMKKSVEPVILLVDELDIICNKRQDVIYNLLDWPTRSIQPLIVVTIANTMDLPERLLMNKVTSRLGLARLTFRPYTHTQLQEIVKRRLVGTNSFNPDAVQLVARKVASVSGDARRALDICRNAAELAERDGDDTLVTMGHVTEALKVMVMQPKVRAVRNASRLEQFVLQAIIAETERTGIEETVFPNVYRMLVSLSALDGFAIASTSVVLAALARLSACRLVLSDQKSSDLDQRIILNCSADEVHYALKEE